MNYHPQTLKALPEYDTRAHNFRFQVLRRTSFGCGAEPTRQAPRQITGGLSHSCTATVSYGVCQDRPKTALYIKIPLGEFNRGYTG